MKPLLKLALKHGRNALSESLYLKLGIDRTRPVFFYALSTDKCNLQCLSCGNWRHPASHEMTTQEWEAALLNIKEFVGGFSINFSGGEPLTKKGFIGLLDFCARQDILAGFTTNGLALSRSVAERVAAVSPFNVNISVDGPNAEIHDYLRGRPGLFEKVALGIEHLVRERAAHQARFPIVIKPTVSAVNFQAMPELVDWAVSMGVTAINFQPALDWDWTPETRDELWIQPGRFPELNQVIAELVELKRKGAPILNTEESLRLMIPHFRGDKAPAKYLPCRVGLGYFYIDAGGGVKICPHLPAIGNLRDQKAHDIWYGDEAAKVRRQTVDCRRLCLLTCVSNKSIGDRVRMGMKLLNPFGGGLAAGSGKRRGSAGTA